MSQKAVNVNENMTAGSASAAIIDCLLKPEESNLREETVEATFVKPDDSDLEPIAKHHNIDIIACSACVLLLMVRSVVICDDGCRTIVQ
jgi:hypothetical protein